jgi:hypothetical protein
MKRLRGKLTFANVVSCLALFVALGGSAYAATQLPKNSVGTKQLKKGAVTPSKLSASAKARMTGPKGATGEAGPRGDRGEIGHVGPEGSTGTTGDAPFVIDASGEVPDVRTTSNVALTGTTSWTPAPGQVGLLVGGFTATLAGDRPGALCSADIRVFDNGTEVASFFINHGTQAFVEESVTLAPVTIGITEPGTQTITATSSEGTGCEAGSKIDSLRLAVAPQG